MFKRKGGVKGFLNNVKKTALFLHGGFPNTFMCYNSHSSLRDITHSAYATVSAVEAV